MGGISVLHRKLEGHLRRAAVTPDEGSEKLHRTEARKIAKLIAKKSGEPIEKVIGDANKSARLSE